VFRNDLSGTLDLMPKMDRGPTDGPPGESLSTVLVTLSASEANELLAALQVWSEEPHAGASGWHMHVTDSEGNELTLGKMTPGPTPLTRMLFAR